MKIETARVIHLEEQEYRALYEMLGTSSPASRKKDGMTDEDSAIITGIYEQLPDPAN